MPGFRSGSSDDVVYAKNFDFSDPYNVTASGHPKSTMLLDGQLIIGSTALNAGGTHCNINTLTPGAGISITNSAGGITISLAGGSPAIEHLTGNTGGQLNPDIGNNFNIIGSGGITFAGAGSTLTATLTGGGFTWNDVSGAFSPLKENGYFVTGTATGTLPAAPAQGDTIKFFVDHASQVLTITASGTQIIRLGTLVSSAGGTATSTRQGDSVELVYRSSDTCWCGVAGFTGSWTMA